MDKLYNLVYKITLLDRLSNNTPPFHYIGSKTKARLKDGMIYNDRNKVYIGSPSIENWNNICTNYSVDILFQCDINTSILEYERYYQLLYDVVQSSEYFNRSIAVSSYFNMPNFGMYKNKDGIVKKLHKDDPLVLSGLFFGINTNTTHSESHKNNIRDALIGENNHFHGKHHKQSTKDRISHANKNRIVSEETRMKMSMVRKGIAKTEEHKNKIGRKNMIMLKNIKTNECVRIDKSEMSNYNGDWMTPFAVKCKLFPNEVKGKSNIINKNTGEKKRINTCDKSKYDQSIWISPQAYSKIKKVLI